MWYTSTLGSMTWIQEISFSGSLKLNSDWHLQGSRLQTRAKVVVQVHPDVSIPNTSNSNRQLFHLNCSAALRWRSWLHGG